MTENFPLAKVLSTRLAPQIAAIQNGENCELLEAATPVTGELLRYWLQRDYCEMRPINFHIGQRQALAAIIYAHEILHESNLFSLYENIAPQALVETPGLITSLQNERHGFPKYCAKMATGTGKTWVLNALLVWQYLNKIAAPEDARFTKNFLLVAPGLIVYDRLLDSFLGKEQNGKRNFETSDIYSFRELFIPETHQFRVFSFLENSVCAKTDIGRKTTSGGMVAITNWHLLAGEEDPNFAPDEEIETPGADVDEATIVKRLLPLSPGVTAGNSLDALDRKFARGGPLQALKDLPDLMVFNDEAHHIHEMKKDGEQTEVEWQKSLTEIAASKGERFIQIDFSATPFNQVGTGKKQSRKYFPHIVVDFDLNDAMHASLVKALALDKRKEVAALPLDFKAERDEKNRTTGLSEGQRVMLSAGLTKLNILEKKFAEVNEDKHPKMLIVCEDTSVTPFVEEFLRSSGLGKDDILLVDSNKKGEMKKDEWDKTRERLFDVDRHAQPRVIVSVLMLREGFDVNNICVIVPLRASGAAILLEQTIGRGLRLMWRGDESIEEAKRETRERISKKLEPNNFFDVLFVVEHPAFAQFYDDLLNGGLAVEVGDDEGGETVTGDVEKVLLREDYQEYDFSIPIIIREAEEELTQPILDPLQLKVFDKMEFAFLKKLVGEGDRFVTQDVQTKVQYGDYRVNGGVMTATGYNDYLGRMTRRIAESLGSGITQSPVKYKEMSRFPFLQVQLPQITGWVDAYIRERLFGAAFDPLEEENWRVLLLDDVAHHIASTFATALVELEQNEIRGNAEVYYRKLSEVPEITVRANSCVEVRKCIYPKLPYSTHNGGLEKTFMKWADSDSEVLALCKIQEYKHYFLHRRYLKTDGFPATYSPDFLVRIADCIYVVETKAQRDVNDENVQRKRRSALTWCEQLNNLPPLQRENREWHYVLLGENSVYEWRDKGARVSELLEYAKLREASVQTQVKMDL
jgi:type III restriction enzyme